MSKENHFDLLVIGSGPAGKRAAIQAAKLNKNVAVIEKAPTIGGISVHTGTIPSKTLREAALYLSGWRQRTFYGRGYRVKDDVNADDLLKRVDITRQHEVDVMQDQFYRNGANVIRGNASFVDPHTLRVEHEGSASEYSADHILVAVGTHPYRPETVPFNGSTILDSDDILKLEHIPKTMTVVGAGVIGVEYATIFSALDTQVTLIDARERILEFVDKDIIDELLHQLRNRGMMMSFGDGIDRIEETSGNKVVTHLNSSRSITSDIVLFASGRMGASETLNLANAGLEADKRGRLNVNEDYQTEVPHIYAAGDVIGFPALAATSMEQGRHAACHAFGMDVNSQPENFPYGIYSVPEISMVGLTEEEVRKEGIAYELGIAKFSETSRGLISGGREGVLKMIFSCKDRKLLGVHIIGEGATELIHIGQAVHTLGEGLDYFVETTFNYPTLAEAYKIAALNAWNRLTAC